MLTALKSSRRWLNLMPLVLVLLAGGALVFSGGVLAAPPDHANPGGKGGGGGDGDDDDGGDTPPDTVFFTLSGDTYTMNSDGTRTKLLLEDFGGSRVTACTVSAAGWSPRR